MTLESTSINLPLATLALENNLRKTPVSTVNSAVKLLVISNLNQCRANPADTGNVMMVLKNFCDMWTENAHVGVLQAYHYTTVFKIDMQAS